MSEPGKLDSFIIWWDFNSKINLSNRLLVSPGVKWPQNIPLQLNFRNVQLKLLKFPQHVECRRGFKGSEHVSCTQSVLGLMLKVTVVLHRARLNATTVSLEILLI